MKDISEEFKGLIYQEEALLAFGFIKQEGAFSFQKELQNHDFSLGIKVEGKTVYLEVLDAATGESFSPFFVAHPMGSFVRQMREEAEELIAKIRETCFEKDYENDYIARFDLFVKQRFGVDPEVTWEEYPDFFTYHRKDNRKWFAIIMQAKYRTLGIDKDGTVNLIDVKADPEEVPGLLKRKDVLPGFHMNKKHWVSFLLDGSAPFENLIPLVEKSYALALGKSALKGPKGYWLVPGNPKYFDVGAAMKRKDTLLWKQSSAVEVGDEVYLYEGLPVGAIRFVFQVLETNIPYHFEGEISIRKTMSLKRIKTLEKPFTKKELGDYGVLYVRGPRSMPKELIAALKERK